jgi:hypothetical protein
LLRVTHPLPENGRFSGSTVLALSKYATIFAENGHTVRRLPPFHPDLMPTEQIGIFVKTGWCKNVI